MTCEKEPTIGIESNNGPAKLGCSQIPAESLTFRLLDGEWKSYLTLKSQKATEMASQSENV